MIANYGTPIKEVNCETSVLPESVYDSDVPVVLRGLVSHWPIVINALQSDQAAIKYINSFYNNKPVNAFMAKPEANGRIFYNDTVDGLNFVQSNVYLHDVLNKIIENKDLPQQPTFYVGSLGIEQHLPGLTTDNSLQLRHQHPRKSIWLGNHSIIAPHFDFPDNLACCVVGERRFTLFPPEQLHNLYVGPLDFTPAGQAISMVDINQPDLVKHPRFNTAMQNALTTVLTPGDAIFIPSMWWHAVRSMSTLNGLVNYWWRDTPEYLGSPNTALFHAMLSIKALPERERKAWQNMFNEYVFEQPKGLYDHLPDKVKKAQTTIDDMTARKLRAQLLNKLK